MTEIDTSIKAILFRAKEAVDSATTTAGKAQADVEEANELLRQAWEAYEASYALVHVDNARFLRDVAENHVDTDTADKLRAIADQMDEAAKELG